MSAADWRDVADAEAEAEALDAWLESWLDDSDTDEPVCDCRSCMGDA